LTSYLLDTHVWAWDLKLDDQLPKRMLGVMDKAENIHVSVISLYEIAQKVRLRKWPEMALHASDLQTALTRQGYQVANVTAEISQLAGLLDWDHRDPFDRMIAATAIHLKLPLMSADTAFDQLSGREDWPGRVW
jgi:PIN domain nuclease of toxin-antitoxin system